ncbi:metalloregulator ArsR/SmtB family transcription factor [Nocardia sp. NPDC050712]|uniref:ArsR/SmtB family transcription factor n=1 Tax=Nocardia sp. NPDC050712 TaxID=3155518 RepID=UPI0033E7EB4F
MPTPATIFEALGDPIRRHILELVATGEHPAGAIVSALRTHTPISQPAVSQHLKVLREANLLQVRPEGTRRLYTLDPTGLALAQSWLTTLTDPLHHLANPLDALATEIARGKRTRPKNPTTPYNEAELA